MVDRSSARCAKGHEPEPGRAVPKYCTRCGSPMLVPCPNGHLVKIGRFCSTCGATLPPVTGPAEVEPVADVDGGARDEPVWAPARLPARRHRLVIPGLVLLILLIGAGTYFAVSRLTSTPATRAAVAAVSSAPTAVPGLAAPEVTTSSVPTTAAASAASSPTFSPTPAAADPATVVTAYYAAINAGDYASAWALGGDNIEAGSYDAFVRGFAGTVSDNLTIRSVAGDTVSVHLDALQTDGSHHYYAGTYTVHNGVIVKASVQQSSN